MTRSLTSALHHISILLSLVWLIACASPATPEGMTVNLSDLPGYASKDNWKDNISLGTVDGGLDTNSLGFPEISSKAFKSALRQSLINFGLFSKKAHPHYELTTSIVKFEHLFIFDTQAQCVALFTIKDKRTQKILLEEELTGKGKATFEDAYIGRRRMRIAAERACKASIRQLLEKLQKQHIKVTLAPKVG